MAVINNHQFIDDHWVDFHSGEQINENATGVVFSLAHFTACSATITEHLKLGIRLANHDPVITIADLLEKIDLIVLEFPAYTDGRAYSQAHRLRQQVGYKKEMRAVGDILVDQYPFMLQCGFDSFEVADNINLAEWESAARLFSSTYIQTSSKAYPHIWERRQN